MPINLDKLVLQIISVFVRKGKGFIQLSMEPAEDNYFLNLVLFVIIHIQHLLNNKAKLVFCQYIHEMTNAKLSLVV
jgi:hypothetical protein